MIMLAEDGIITNDKIYVVLSDIPLLCAIDRNTNKVECVGTFYRESLLMRQASRKIVICDNNLIIIPYNARNIYVYNLETFTMTDVEVPEWDAEKYMYIEALVCDDKVIMIGAFQKNIVEYDIKTKNVTVRNCYFEGYDNPKDLFCRSGYVLEDNCLYIALAVSNTVLKIDIHTWDYKAIKIGSENNRFSGIAYDGKRFWLSPRRGKDVIVWNGVDDFKVVELPLEMEKQKCNFAGIYYYDNKIWLHGFEGGETVIIDPETECIIKHMDYRYAFFRKDREMGILGQAWDGSIHLFCGEERKIFKLDVDEDELRKAKELFDYSNIFPKKKIIQENSIFGLKELIEITKERCDND